VLGNKTFSDLDRIDIERKRASTHARLKYFCAGDSLEELEQNNCTRGFAIVFNSTTVWLPLLMNYGSRDAIVIYDEGSEPKVKSYNKRRVSSIGREDGD
jgi:hypothetical protein